MERIEPKAGPDLQDLTFRRAPRWAEPASDGRFPLGIAIFVVVALVYPWYSYWVQSHLLARDIEQGVEKFTESVDRESRAVSAQLAQGMRQSQLASERRRVATMRVIGASASDPPLVVVEGQASFQEADALICGQAEAWLGRSLDGQVIRVQRARGSGSAASIQELACP